MTSNHLAACPPEYRKVFEQVLKRTGDRRVHLWDPPPFDRTNVIRELKAIGASIRKHVVHGEEFRRYLDRAKKTGHYDAYAEHFGAVFERKALEHFVSFELLEISESDVYMDVASSGSVVPEIQESLYGVKRWWRQDISYPSGVRGNKIGSDAAKIPLGDSSVTKMGLHCSFEHFESDADTGFIREGARLLRPGGRICILPLYMSDSYHIMSSLELILKKRIPDFEPDTPIFWSPKHNNYHGRFYDPRSLKERVLDAAGRHGLLSTIIDLSFENMDMGMGTNLAVCFKKA